MLGPLLLITFGLLLLLSSLGLLPEGFWRMLWRFWPVILIILGLNVLAGQSESRTVYILLALLGIAIIGGVLILAWTGVSHYEAAKQYGENLRDKHLQGTNWVFYDLSGANLSGVHLEDANLIFVDLSNADLEGAHLDDANLIFTDLSNANLKNVVVDGADLIFVDLEGADLEGTDIYSATRIFTSVD